MIRIRWRWCLPVAQVILALALHVYESREHRPGAYSAPLFGLRYNPNLSPAPAGRLSLGINFPAVVLAYPFRNVYGTVFADDTEYTNIYIQVRDLYYFSGVAVFWWLVGLGLDRRRQHSQRRWSRKARFAAKACGLGFGLLCLVFAQSMIRATYEPQRDIGLCGLVWSCGLIAFFTWQLVREAGAGDTTRRVLRIATMRVRRCGTPDRRAVRPDPGARRVSSSLHADGTGGQRLALLAERYPAGRPHAPGERTGHLASSHSTEGDRLPGRTLPDSAAFSTG